MCAEGRPEEALLIIEVPENRVFTHVRKMSYLPSARSVIALMRKQPARRLQNAVPPQRLIGYKWHISFRHDKCEARRALNIVFLRPDEWHGIQIVSVDVFSDGRD
jgi:hypothetical protein